MYLTALLPDGASQPFRQAIYPFMGIGCATSPLILQPFLSSSSSSSSFPLLIPYSMIAVCFLIGSAVTIATWKLCLSTHASDDKCPATSNSLTISSAETRRDKLSGKQQEDPPHGTRGAAGIMLIILELIGFVLHYGMSESMNSFTALFVTRRRHALSPETGAQMTTVLFASYSGTGLASILYVRWIGLEMNFLLNTVLLLTANALLLVFGDDTDASLLYLALVLFGAATASTAPCLYEYVEGAVPSAKFVVPPLFAVVSTISYVGFVAGVSVMIERDARFLLWIVAVTSVFMILLILPIILLGRRLRSLQAKQLLK